MAERNIHVLHIVSSLEGGGIERQLQYLVNNLPDRFRCTIVYLKEPQTGDVAITPSLQSRVQLIRISRCCKWDIIGVVRSTAAIIREHDPDVIHLWFPPVATLPAAFLAFPKRISTVSAQRRSLRYRGKISAWFTDRLCYFQHVLSTRIAANFPPSAEPFLYRWLFRHKAGAVIPNGVDVAASAEPKNDFRIGQTCTLWFVGRIVKQKRVDILLKSVIALRREGLNLNLVICGNESDKRISAELRELAEEYDCSGAVTFLGYREDWHHLVTKDDVFVLPSVSEGMPNVLFEAMLLKMPCIATCMPEIGHWVCDEREALLVKPGSVEELCEAIRKAVKSESLRRSIAEKGAELSAQFTVEHMVKQYDQLYHALAERNKV